MGTSRQEIKSSVQKSEVLAKSPQAFNCQGTQITETTTMQDWNTKTDWNLHIFYSATKLVHGGWWVQPFTIP